MLSSPQGGIPLSALSSIWNRIRRVGHPVYAATGKQHEHMRSCFQGLLIAPVSDTEHRQGGKTRRDGLSWRLSKISTVIQRSGSSPVLC